MVGRHLSAAGFAPANRHRRHFAHGDIFASRGQNETFSWRKEKRLETL